MAPTTTSPALADAADLLSSRLRQELRRFARYLQPHTGPAGRRFAARLQELGFTPAQRNALSAVTLGAAARIIARSGRIADLIEQVEYHGRRLAKLNLPPSDIVAALGEYDHLLLPAFAGLPEPQRRNFEWVRQQLQFSVVLTLNKAFYQVRETEAQTFYELSRVELESPGLEELLAGFVTVLKRFCGARQARLYLLDHDAGQWVLRARAGDGRASRPLRGGRWLRIPAASQMKRRLGRPRCVALEGRHAALSLDARWPGRYRTLWSVPLLSTGEVAGVIQFAFTKPYDWLPREVELLEAAAERCMAAAERTRLIEDLAAREEKIRALAEHMLHVEEMERRRISRELHDETGQALLYLNLQLELLAREYAGRDPGLAERIRSLHRVCGQVIQDTRRLIAALSPAVLEQFGLEAALKQLIQRFRELYPCRVTLRIGRLGKLPKSLEIVVYRLVQECCNNIAKHSRAKRVNISLASADGVLRLDVEDDGVGFLVAEALARQGSFGLAGMRERVTLLGGHFAIESRPARGAGRRKTGTRITAELPVSRSG